MAGRLRPNGIESPAGKFLSLTVGTGNYGALDGADLVWKIGKDIVARAHVQPDAGSPAICVSWRANGAHVDPADRELDRAEIQSHGWLGVICARTRVTDQPGCTAVPFDGQS